MQELPAELRLLVVEQVLLVEDLAALSQTSRLWRDAIYASRKNWVQRLPQIEGEFAATLNGGAWILQHYVNGRASIFIEHSCLSLHFSQGNGIRAVFVEKGV